MTATAVLASGGLDSAALLAETASTGVAYPIYVEAGMVWESSERLPWNDSLRPSIVPMFGP